VRGPLAQLAEQRTFNPRVVGSSPTGPTSKVPSQVGLTEDIVRVGQRLVTQI
jgi:hypothetical protein